MLYPVEKLHLKYRRPSVVGFSATLLRRTRRKGIEPWWTVRLSTFTHPVHCSTDSQSGKVFNMFMSHNRYPRRFCPLLLLLALTAGYFPAVPYFCRIFTVNAHC